MDSWPTPIVFMGTCSLRTCVVQQPLRDVLPDCVSAIQADRICRLDFHDTLASSAGDAQNVALDLRQMPLP
jgi:hypothetical protein